MGQAEWLECNGVSASAVARIRRARILGRDLEVSPTSFQRTAISVTRQAYSPRRLRRTGEWGCSLRDRSGADGARRAAASAQEMSAEEMRGLLGLTAVRPPLDHPVRTRLTTPFSTASATLRRRRPVPPLRPSAAAFDHFTSV